MKPKNKIVPQNYSIEMNGKNIQLGLLLTILALTVFHILSLRGLYADGSSFLVKMLTSGTFEDWDRARRFAQLLLQLPVVLALKAGVENIQLLAVLHSLGLFGLPALLWLMGLLRLRDEALFWPFFVVYAVISMNAGFFAIGEFNLAYALVGYSFAVLISQKNINTIQGILLVLVAVALVCSYEALIFLGPLLYWAAMRRVNWSDRRPANFWLLLATLCYACATFNSLWSILYPRSPGNLSGAMAGLMQLLANKQLLISALVTGLYFLLVFFKFNSITRTIVAGVSLLLSALLFLPEFWSSPSEHYAARSPVGLLMWGLFSGLLLVRMANKSWIFNTANIQEAKKLVWIIPCVLFAGLLSADVYHTMGHARFIDRFETFVNANQGFHAIEETPIDSEIYGWSWPQPSLSLLLREDADKAVILNRKDYLGWQPYQPTKSLPDFTRYYK